MKYKIEGEVDILEEEHKDFELSLKNKSFDFFRYLSENNAKIEIRKRNKFAEKSNKKIIDSIIKGLKKGDEK